MAKRRVDEGALQSVLKSAAQARYGTINLMVRNGHYSVFSGARCSVVVPAVLPESERAEAAAELRAVLAHLEASDG